VFAVLFHLGAFGAWQEFNRWDADPVELVGAMLARRPEGVLAHDAGRLARDAVLRTPWRSNAKRPSDHDLYGVAVRQDGTRVRVELLKLAVSTPRQAQVIEQRSFAGVETAAAAAYQAELEQKAQLNEEQAFDRMLKEREQRALEAEKRARAEAARSERSRKQAAATAERAREAALHAESEAAHRRDDEREAASLAQALRRR
jgi:hypothetical protein